LNGATFGQVAPFFNIGTKENRMNNARYRTSPTLTIVPHDQNVEGRAMIGIFEFISNTFAYCSADALLWLSVFKEWKSVAEVNFQFPQLDAQSLYCEIEPLIDANFISCEGTTTAKTHDQYLRNWNMGHPAALFHFSTLHSTYCASNEEVEKCQALTEGKPGISLSWSNATSALALGNPNLRSNAKVLQTMAARRTNRSSTGQMIGRDEIGSCLFAGLGITGFVNEKYGDLPLSMTPSGGARNPYEAFVFVKRVAQTPAGLYHYNALTHELELIKLLADDFNLSPYLGHQTWVDDMAAVVVLTAFMDRTSWKYANGSAYRVIYLEAGHIAQNAMLMATSLGLTACPTAALNHIALNELLDLGDDIGKSAIYAFTIDKALAYPDKIVPNKKLAFLAAEVQPSLGQNNQLL
jgi:SagB-type dehydrogenase family enzyme